MYSVYVIRSDSYNRFYIGSSKDVPTRVARHNAGHSPSTKAFRPWVLVYSEAFSTLAEARKREMEIKDWKNPAYMVKMLGLDI